MGNGTVGVGGLKCKCGKSALILHPASGQPLCKKHFLRYIYKKVLRESAKLGILSCNKITIKIDKFNQIEARIVAEALKDWAKRKSCPLPEFDERGIYPLSSEKVVYLALRAFYELDKYSYELANPQLSKNPAYTLLPFEVAVYAKIRGMQPSNEYGKGPLWEIALDVTTSQTTETYNVFKILDNLKLLFPVA